MNLFFITYGDKQFAVSKKRIVKQASSLNLFNKILDYGPEDLDQEILSCEAMKYKRGGGLWSWKPYITLLTLNKMEEGDILVYCDAGCTLSNCSEWKDIFERLEKFNMICSLIHQRNEKWSRKTVIDYFASLGNFWPKYYQISATAFFLKKTSTTVKLIEEWKDLMIYHPNLVLDVIETERHLESANFIENRHDQSILSGLVYKYRNSAKILIKWNNFEGRSFSKRAIIASRLSDQNTKYEKIKFEYLKYYVRRILNVIWYPFLQKYWENNK